MDPGVIYDLLKQSVSRLFIGVDCVEEEVQMLEDNLRSIRQLLDFAEQRQVKDDALKLWSNKLKGLSEEMKDVLDEWNTATLKSAIDGQWQVSQNPPVKEGQKPKCACFCFWEKVCAFLHFVFIKIIKCIIHSQDKIELRPAL